MNPYIFKQIVKNNWVPVVISDLSGVILYTNEAADNLFGYGEGELNGISVAVMNGDLNFPAEKIIGEVVKNEGWSGEIFMKRKNGELFYGKATVWLIKDEDGNPAAFASNSNDLTDTIRMQKQQEEEHARLKAIIDNTADFILSIDRDFNVTLFNQQLTDRVKLRYGFEVVPGMSVFKFMPPGSEEETRKIYERVLKGEKVVSVDGFVIADGSKVYYEVSYYPIIKNEEVTGISIFTRDTTERKRKEKLLETTLKERELLLSEIHHRVKNNLAIVSGFLQLEELNTTNEEVIQILGETKTRIKATALVHELLYKNESLSNIDFGQYITDLMKVITGSYNTRKAELELKCPPLGKQVDVEKAVSCGLILNELISNAYKHAFEPAETGKISVQLTQAGSNYDLIVSDNGKGLPDEFDLENCTTTGMMLVKTFVEQLNGKLEVKKDNGATFKMSFALEENINY